MKSEKIWKQLCETLKERNLVYCCKDVLTNQIRLKRLMALDAPRPILVNTKESLNKRKKKVEEVLDILVRYLYEREKEMAKKYKELKPTWKDYLSAEEKLLYAIFHKVKFD